MLSCWLITEMVRVPQVFAQRTATLISITAFTRHSEMLALMVAEWKMA